MPIAAFFAVGIGAFLGALMRWGFGILWNATVPQLPLGTLAANLVGGFIIGVALASFEAFQATPLELRLFITTGFCGGLTTFSTFSAEAVIALNRQQFGWFCGHHRDARGRIAGDDVRRNDAGAATRQSVKVDFYPAAAPRKTRTSHGRAHGDRDNGTIHRRRAPRRNPNSSRSIPARPFRSQADRARSARSVRSVLSCCDRDRHACCDYA